MTARRGWRTSPASPAPWSRPRTASRPTEARTGNPMGPRPHNNVLEEASSDAPPARVSAELDGWMRAEPDPTLGGLVAAFGHKSFAIVFMLLLGVPALPLPTGGGTHLLELRRDVFALAPPRGRARGAPHLLEVAPIVLALELLAGPAEIRLPRRWARLRLGGPARRRFIDALLA